MKDTLTTAYSDLIQNQIELTSTVQSMIDEATSRGVSVVHINELRKRMESFESHLNALSKQLIEDYDGMEESGQVQPQPGTASI
jgi:hypothetical protein